MINKSNLLSQYSTIKGKRCKRIDYFQTEKFYLDTADGDLELTPNLEGTSVYDKSSRFQKSKITETIESDAGMLIRSSISIFPF